MTQFLFDKAPKIKSVLMLLISLTILSCASKKDILYFQDSENLNLTKTDHEFDPVIETNDILYISLSSINEELLSPFLRKSQQTQQLNSANPGLDGYLVNIDGTISFPVIGDIEVAGHNRAYVENILKEKLLIYIKDIVVDVRIMNFKVSVIGEVKNPGVYTIDDERVTITEALALAGDLTEDGNRHNITVIREENGVQKVAKIDLTHTEFYKSSFYYLKQNDLVYVEPSTKGVKKSGFIPDIPALLSLFTVILSSIILITAID